MARTENLSDFLTDVADAIRDKKGTTTPIKASDFDTEIESIEGGGSFEPLFAIEVESLLSTGYPDSVKLHGEEIPNGLLRYFNYSNNSNVNLTRKDNIKIIGTSALQNAYVNFSNNFFDEVLYIGAYGVAPSKSNTETITIPKWNGKDKDGRLPDSVFRVNGNGIFIVNYNVPSMQYVGSYLWYQNNRNITVQIGSIGHGVLQVDNRPFGGTTGTSNITCYTTGDKLDTISTGLMNQAGANVHFTFKASENTTYNGTTYQAGETMLTA